LVFLFWDESLANVDEPMRQAIIYKIKSIFPHACFLYISHNVVEVSRFCDRIVVFRGAHQTPQTLDINGQDHHEDQPLDNTALERSMLEIMNA
jgi:ABC-type multidrug transport system ATPase subunit